MGRKKNEIHTREAKFLFFDTENLPLKCYSWGTFKQNINLDYIIEEKSLICSAHKWMGKDKVILHSIGDNTMRFRKNPYDDEQVIRKMHDILSQADVLIAHNLKFDKGNFNARAIKYGLAPLPPHNIIDTLMVARWAFNFTSNKLDFLAKYLGVCEKIKVSGMLWRRIAEGDMDAVREMEGYNIQDVHTLEAVYMKLRAWIAKHPNMNLYLNPTIPVCPVCGSEDLSRQGTRPIPGSRVAKYQTFKCGNCGHWSSSGKGYYNFKPAERIR